ncbi:thiamine phosphate synthase [Halorhodospira halochloris]|uniref:Thiamine-phosphate synthase n=1 Tax=Halorhodospira halochloris TaxID=1052 RepID=A0A0X8XBK3_HALHR|nr:thiamine phosphate synthase [Halorhodospira halochloris]MBK1652154.1 thiamine phosphate synthase [Halorhodospira halochloris]MCG5530582.1 thiamine phosphate synthase [Halorhodospira halochloris]MCG5547836.1 thiamine phosphate synthase [Halorhodospira halochloris]BAU58428.1 thiamin-phosphate pyrophosphorylase [Halorhodospira halochloris]
MVEITGLYAVTSPRRDLYQASARALRGGVSILQYRDKGGDTAQQLDEAGQLSELCEQSGALFIVNDDVELAAQVGAGGVHLGRDDGSLAAARSKLGQDAVIGVSCYNEIERVRHAAAAGADYVAVGSVFPSPTKPHAARASLEMLATARSTAQLPVVAIGGIGRDNIASVAAAGADAAALVSAIFAADDIESAVAELVLRWRSGKGQ